MLCRRAFSSTYSPLILRFGMSKPVQRVAALSPQFSEPEKKVFFFTKAEIQPYTPFPVLFNQANRYYRQGHFLKSLELVALAARKTKPGTIAAAGVLSMQGKNLVALGRYPEGITALKKALSIFDKKPKNEFQKTPVYVALGQAYFACDNYTEASQYSDKVIAAYEKAFDHHYPEILDYLDAFETGAEYRPLKVFKEILERLESIGSPVNESHKILSEEVVLTFADALQLQGKLFKKLGGVKWMAKMSFKQAKILYQKASSRCSWRA